MDDSIPITQAFQGFLLEKLFLFISFIYPHDIADIQIIVWKQYIKFIIDGSVLSFSIGSLHFYFFYYEIIKSVFKL